MEMYCGLQNEGATCYMNSILQSLFFTNEFRRIVYSIDTNEENVDESFIFWLQAVFVLMEHREPDSFYMRRFMEIFGWSDVDTQEDIEECSRQLIGKVEEAVQGTPAHDALCALFSGELVHTIRCDDGYETSNTETFWNLRLYIGDNDDISEAIVSSLEPTTLDEFVHDGDKKSAATQYHEYHRLPKVLHIQLMRFRDDGRKNSKRFKFHNHLDLRYMIPNKQYRLHSVLVHSGSVAAGHYTAYISPELNDEWYLFNDSVVEKVSVDAAIQANWGNIRSRKSAYMLVYVETLETNHIAEPVAPPRLSERVNRISINPSPSTELVNALNNCDIDDFGLDITICSLDKNNQRSLALYEDEKLSNIHRRIASINNIEANQLLIYDSHENQICPCQMEKTFVDYVGIRLNRMTRTERKKLVIYYMRNTTQINEKSKTKCSFCQ